MPTVNLDVDLPGDGYLDIDKDFNVIDIFSNLPYRDGLVGSYFLSNQTISPLINYADINNSLKQFGSPVVGKSYAVLNRKNYFDTGLPSTETISIMAISLPLLETSGMGGLLHQTIINQGRFRMVTHCGHLAKAMGHKLQPMVILV